MDVTVAEQDLDRLDSLEVDTLVLFFEEGDGPLEGLVGLVDWRLTGRLSRYLQRGWFTGALGEKLLIPTHDRLPMARILGIGIGSPEAIDLDGAERLGELIGLTLSSAKARAAAMPLPGEPKEEAEIKAFYRVLRRGIARAFDGSVVLLGDAKLLREIVDSSAKKHS